MKSKKRITIISYKINGKWTKIIIEGEAESVNWDYTWLITKTIKEKSEKLK